MHNSIKNYLCFVGGIIFSLNYGLSEVSECAYVREVSTTCVCRLEWVISVNCRIVESLVHMHFCKFNFSRKRRTRAHYSAAFLLLHLPQKKDLFHLYKHFVLFLSRYDFFLFNEIKSLLIKFDAIHSTCLHVLFFICINFYSYLC